jgi:hypothetical protein
MMGAIRLVVAPFRRIANSRLFQVALVIAIILSLDHYSYDYAVLRPIAEGLKDLVTATVQLCSRYFRVGILTDPVLQVGLIIAYVYIVCLVAFFLLRLATAFIIDLIGASSATIPTLGSNSTATTGCETLSRSVSMPGCA